MTTTWYYLHAGATHGPFSAAELRRRAAAGLLGPDDLVWPRDGGPQRAVVAGAALALPDRVGETAALPDWLADVQRAEQAASPTGPPRPDWLEDVRRSVPPAAPDPGKGAAAGVLWPACFGAGSGVLRRTMRRDHLARWGRGQDMIHR